MGKHAFLSASASHRWLECPPSAKLCSEQEDRASPYAQQGTDCHELCAYLVEKSLGRDVEDPAENLTYYDQEMQDCAESYRDYVTEQIEAGDTAAALDTFARLYGAGKDVGSLLGELASQTRDLLIRKTAPSCLVKMTVLRLLTVYTVSNNLTKVSVLNSFFFT